MNTPLFFIHGGPGFNSFAEAGMLGPLFSKRRIEVCFWNEPSRYRPDGVFSEKPPTFPTWLQALESAFGAYVERSGGRVHLVGQSFGVQGVVYLAKLYARSIARITLVAPGIDVHQVQKNICELAQQDFRDSEPDKSRAIALHMSESRVCFDPPMEIALGLAFQDSKLMTHYWRNPLRMREWEAYFATPETQINVDSFVGVSRTFEASHLRNFPSHALQGIPVKVVFGERDPIIHRSNEGILSRLLFKEAVEFTFREAGHFPHLERAHEFVDFCSN